METMLLSSIAIYGCMCVPLLVMMRAIIQIMLTAVQSRIPMSHFQYEQEAINLDERQEQVVQPSTINVKCVFSFRLLTYFKRGLSNYEVSDLLHTASLRNLYYSLIHTY